MADDRDSVNKAAYRERLSDLVDEPSKLLLPIEGYEQMPLVSLEEATQPLTDIVPDIYKMVYVAKENYKDQPPKLTTDLSAAITIYTMGGTSNNKPLYHTLNSILRCGTPDRRDKLKCWFLYLKLFITALSSLPSHRGTIYRGVKQDLSNFYTKGREFVWWGFSSCTKSLGVLQSNLFLGNKGVGTLFIIDSFTGKDIRQYSHYEKEEEILLVAARRFIVVDRLNLGPDSWVIHIKEIEPPFPFLKTDSSISSTFEIISPIAPPLSTIDASTNTDYLLTLDAKTDTDDLLDPPKRNLTHQEAWFDAKSDTGENEATSLDVALINSQLYFDTTSHHNSAPVISDSAQELMTSRAEPYNESSLPIIKPATYSSLDGSIEGSNNSEVKLIRFTNEIMTVELIDIFMKIAHNNLQLHTIFLVNNQLGDERMYSIMQVLLDRSQLKIFIIDNEITDKGAALLAQLLINNSNMMNMLSLDKNLITDQGVIALMNALGQSSNSSLKSLSLSRNPSIGDGCVNDIVNVISDNHSLRCLYLDKCNLSNDGKERIRNTIGKKVTLSLQL